MPDPVLGELKMFAFNFAPRDWAFCEGQIMPINQNQALYSLLGTSYGGDGRTSFALPDLRGRAPMGTSSAYPQGHAGGQETVVLSAANVPSHTHDFVAGAVNPANQAAGNDAFLAEPSASVGAIYNSSVTTAPDTRLRSDAIGTTGGQAHENMMPSLAIRWAICVRGVFPSRN